MRKAIGSTTVLLAALAAPEVRADDLSKTRLDFSLPEVPAFTALGVSPSKVSRPTSARDFAAALGTGISPDGKVQSGLALEASPYKLAGGDSASDYLGGLRFSLATNSVAAGADTKTQAAAGLRWSLFGYHPEQDPSLRKCLVAGLSVPEIDDTIPDDEAASGGTPAPSPPPARLPDESESAYAARVAALKATDEAKAATVEAKKAVADAKEKLAKAKLAKDLKSLRESCRSAFKAAHLAQSGFELAYVRSWQGVNDARLSALEPLTDSLWLSFAFAAVNTYAIPTDVTSSTDAKPWAKALESKKGKSPWDGAIGFEPVIFGRADRTHVSSPTASATQTDLFFAARLPLLSAHWSFFAEAGIKFVNAGRADAPAAEAKKTVPLGVGGDLRLGDGTWLGAYFGADAVTGNFFSLGNLKWAIGESRPY